MSENDLKSEMRMSLNKLLSDMMNESEWKNLSKDDKKDVLHRIGTTADSIVSEWVTQGIRLLK